MLSSKRGCLYRDVAGMVCIISECISAAAMVHVKVHRNGNPVAGTFASASAFEFSTLSFYP